MTSKYKLILENIGKFKDISFDLDVVTVFYGPNEAGKTTIIDGMINSMISSRKNQFLNSHILIPRYGNQISSKLKINSTNEEIPKIDHDLVKNLLVVRASSMELDFVNNKTEASWVEGVRNKLFSGGVDPQTIIDSINEMEKKSKVSKSPLAEVKELDQQITSRKVKHEENNVIIQGYAATITHSEKLKKQESQFENDLALATKNLNGKKDKLKSSKKGSDREMILGIQDKISQKNKLEELLGRMAIYKDEHHLKLKGLEDALKKLEGKRDIDKNYFNRAKNELKKLTDESEKESGKIQKLERNHDLARRTRNSLEIQISERGETQQSKPKGMVIAASLISILIGIISLFQEQESFKYAGAGLLVAGVIVLILSFLTKKPPEANQLNLKTEIKTFNQEYRENPLCPDNNYSDASDFLRNVMERFTQEKNVLDRIQDKKVELDLEVQSLRGLVNESTEKISALSEEYRKSLIQGVTDSDGYLRMLQEKKRHQETLAKLESELDSSVTQLGVENRIELVRHIENRIIEINNHPLELATLSHKEFQILEREVLGQEKNKEELEQNLDKVQKDLISINTEVQIKIGTISHEQVHLEKEIQKLESEKDKKNIQMESFRLLKTLVEEIAADSQDKFYVLSEGINKYMKIILGSEREITFKNMECIDNILCVDHSGLQRDVTQLSSGTKDAFVLAARLALLERVALSKDSFLLLDDPFIMMDDERQERSILAIKKFHDEFKLPLVLFTKDQATRNTMSSVFNSVRVIELVRV